MLGLISSILRLSSVGIKFIFVFFVAHALTDSGVADYGVLTALIAITMLLIGFDFYSYANKELISKTDKWFVLSNQLFFSFICYLILIPVTLIFCLSGLLNPTFAVYFYCIVIIEHFSQEIYRALISLEKPVQANIVFFLRNGAWVFLPITNYYLSSSFHISGILTSWIIGGLVSVIIGVYFLWKKIEFRVQKNAINLKWIKNGFVYSLFFYGSTIGFKLVEYSDRFFLNSQTKKVEVASYLIYAQVINVLNILLFTSIFSIQFPKMFKHFENEDVLNFENAIKKMRADAFKLSIVLAIALVLAIHPIITFLGKESYLEYINAFYLLLISSFIFNVSLVDHFILYSQNRVKYILISSLFAACINVSINFLFVPVYGSTGAAWSSLIAMVSLLTLKKYYAKRR